MDRNELTAAVAGALALAFLLGWVTRWIFSRLNASAHRGTVHHSAEIQAAEEARSRADDRRAEAELRASEAEAELARARAGAATLEEQLEEIRVAYREAMGGQA